MGNWIKSEWNSHYQLLFYNGSEAPIAALLLKFGIKEEDLANGRALHQALEDAQFEHGNAQLATQTAQDSLDQQRATAQAALVQARGLARALTVGNPVLQRQLHLSGRIPRSLPAWLHMAEGFYAALAEHPALWQQVQEALPHVEGLPSVAALRERARKLEAAQHEQREASQLHAQASVVIRTCYRYTAGLARLALKNHRGYLTAVGLK